MESNYANIREILGHFIGQKIVDITQHDQEDFATEGSFVMLLFDSGDFLKFPIGDAGFHYSIDEDES